MTMDFPSALEQVHVGGGLWLRVKVLTLPEATRNTAALEAAVGAATRALANDPERAGTDPVVTDGPMRGARLSALCASLDKMQEVSREAVTYYAWSEAARAAEERRALAIAQADAALRQAIADADLLFAAASAESSPNGESVDTAAAEAARDDAKRAAMAARDVAVAAASAAFDPGPMPTMWSPIKIVRNPQDEQRERGWLCFASLDQVAPGWAWVCGGIALRAAFRAAGEVAPLSVPGT